MRKPHNQRTRTAIVVASMAAIVSCATTAPILDDRGAPVAGSIASLERVTINGTRQWLLMRGHDTTAPVMLWLAGGPGGSEIGRTRDRFGPLEEEVVFVNWEQPGGGKSFAALDIRRATVEEFVDHTIAVSEYLRRRFGRERIILAGHSWGSIIGLLAVAERPDLYAAYIGCAQQVEFVENDRIGYHMVIERARAAGDNRTVRRLERIGPPPYTAADRHAYAFLFQRVFRYSPAASGAPHLNSNSIFNPEEYRPRDTIDLVRGILRGCRYVYPQLVGRDFRREISRLDVAAFFVTGRFDRTCVAELTYEWYRLLDAPLKRHYWFGQSGHEACYEEAERFRRIVVEEVPPIVAGTDAAFS